MKFIKINSRILSTIVVTGFASLACLHSVVATAANADTGTASSPEKSSLTASGTTKTHAASPANKTAAKKVIAKKAAAKKPVADVAMLDEDDELPNITESAVNEYNCELSNSVTIYTNASDSAHIAMRWKQKLYRLKRVDTTTGADRFENHKSGFVWIGIPAKGMLLDSRHGQQLANECKTRDQVAEVATASLLASNHK